MKSNLHTQKLMKRFWNSKAVENPGFYIATWRGFRRRDLEDFYLDADDVAPYLRSAGYHPTGSDRMLEIGCGLGRMTHGFAALFGEVYGVDVSDEMIRQAREKLANLKNVRLYENNGTDLAQFGSGTFDFCFSFIVFQHIPDKAIVRGYIDEACRVLKSGGVLHFQVSGLEDPDTRIGEHQLRVKLVYRRFIRGPVLQVWRRLLKGPHGFESPAWTGTRFTADEIAGDCRSAGLQVTAITGHGTQYLWVTAQKP